MAFKEYNEHEHQEDVISVDIDTGEVRAPQARGAKKEAWNNLIVWAEKERGFKFIPQSIPKQFKAFQIASKEGLKVGELKERWVEMSEDDFWSKKGFDWMNVVMSFSKKRK